MELRPCILAFAGSIGSGKSTLSSGVAKVLGWPWCSFGVHVRMVASSQGVDADSREVLQDIGSMLIAQGWVSFCQAVLGQAHWQSGQALVVDGVRHTAALETLRTLAAPLPVLLVYVAVDVDEHVERLHAKGIASDERRKRIEGHMTEVQVATLLPALAALTVDGSRPWDELIEEIARWVCTTILSLRQPDER